MKHVKTFLLFEAELLEGLDHSSLEKYLAAFPDNTTTWSQATDELPDMYDWLTEYINETNDKEILQPVGRANCKTPSQWNTKYKAAIFSAVKLLNEEGKKAFKERFEIEL